MTKLLRTLNLGWTLVFLLGALAPGAQAQAAGGPPASSSGDLVVADPKADWGFFGASPPVSTAQSPVTDAIDLTQLRVFGEDSEGFFIEISLADLTALSAAPEFGSAYYDVRFSLEGSKASYYLQWNVFGQSGQMTGRQPASVRFCLQADGRSCFQQRAIGTVDWDASTLLAYVPKASLLGRAPTGSSSAAPASLPAGLAIGAQLTKFQAYTQSNFPSFFITDEAPDGGDGAGPFVFHKPMANDRIRLELVQEVQEDVPDNQIDYGGYYSVATFPLVAVSPGSPALVQVRVQNENAAKRLVNLSAEVVNDTGRHFEARVVPTIGVPGHESRTVNLVLNVSASALHRESVLVRLTARSLGFPDELGALTVKALASVPPSPQKKELFLHTAGSASFLGSTDDCSVTFELFCYEIGSWMNTLEKDPSAKTDKAMRMPSSSFRTDGVQYAASFPLDAPLNQDLVLDTAQPIKATIALQSTLPIQGTLVVTLSTQDGQVGSGQVEVAQAGTFEVSFLPLIEAHRILAGNSLVLGITLTSPHGPSTADWALHPMIVPAQSKLALPIVADPLAKRAGVVPAGPALLSLTPAGDAQEFVNPGRVKVFRVTLVNEGVQDDVVTIQEEHAPTNWWVDLRPGSQYRLKPGESATVGILVKSPPEAPEGQMLNLTLNATSQADPDAVATTTLTAVVTRGVDIPDESDNYTADEDTAKNLSADKGGKSPGPEALGALVAVAAVVVVISRRRRD